jgi:hypothetical protein
MKTYHARAVALAERINDRLGGRLWSARLLYEEEPPFLPRTPREAELAETVWRLWEILAPDDGP